MPKQPDQYLVPYDLAAWRKRCNLTQEQTEAMLGMSTSKVWRLEKSGMVPRYIAWACFGIERQLWEQQQQTVTP